MRIDKGIIKLYSKFQHGDKNLITDVPGVKVGNCTVRNPEKNVHTGVTAILPHEGNIFKSKVFGGVSVINGFGKSAGLIQIEELGTIESPIIMTNTLSVGVALNATVKYMLEKNDDIGISTGTVNCIVTECNDGIINDIRGLHVKEEDVTKAIISAKEDFEEGDVGAGTGMYCLGLKGGIGSSSRLIKIGEVVYVVGALVLSNFGSPGNLVIGGRPIGKEINYENKASKDKGSIIIVIATDIPLNERQLKRVAKRSTISLGRVGSFIGNGSGDIAIAFSTANRVEHYANDGIMDIKMICEEKIDEVFEATVETVEEAIISSLYHSKTCNDGKVYKIVKGLKEFL